MCFLSTPKIRQWPSTKSCIPLPIVIKINSDYFGGLRRDDSRNAPPPFKVSPRMSQKRTTKRQSSQSNRPPQQKDCDQQAQDTKQVNNNNNITTCFCPHRGKESNPGSLNRTQNISPSAPEISLVLFSCSRYHLNWSAQYFDDTVDRRCFPFIATLWRA